MTRHDLPDPYVFPHNTVRPCRHCGRLFVLTVTHDIEGEPIHSWGRLYWWNRPRPR